VTEPGETHLADLDHAGSPPIWRDTTSRLCLLGSIHYLPPEAYPLPSQIDLAYSESSRVVFEARPDRHFEQSLGTPPWSASLPTILGRDLYSQLAEAAEQFSFDLKRYSTLRPIAIAANIYRSALSTLGRKPSLGIESYLLARACEDKKDVGELEDVNYVYRRLISEGLNVEIRYLQKALDELQGIDGRDARYFRAWKDGDLATLEALAIQEREECPELIEIIINERNRNWLPQLQGYQSSDEPVLVAVGMDHLVGEGNVRDLLEESGARFEKL
jgi:uncharacterized protein YbaP (TraB family)